MTDQQQPAPIRTGTDLDQRPVEDHQLPPLPGDQTEQRDAMPAGVRPGDAMEPTSDEPRCRACGGAVERFGTAEAGWWAHVVRADEVGRHVAVVDELAIDVAHLDHQREFSARVFGPGDRTEGVLDHMAKEAIEVRDAVRDGDDPLPEWVDLVILALDGAWRTGATSQQIIDAIKAKQARNEARTWPDWRTAEPGKAIEHDRTRDVVS